jgi:hypothetical protein
LPQALPLPQKLFLPLLLLLLEGSCQQLQARAELHLTWQVHHEVA